MEQSRRRSSSGSDGTQPGSSSRSDDTMLSCDNDPPEIDMTRSFGRDDVFNELCDVMPPMIVARHSPAIVNFDSADSLSRQPSRSFRRMTSSRLSDSISGTMSGVPDLMSTGSQTQRERYHVVESGLQSPRLSAQSLHSLGGAFSSMEYESSGDNPQSPLESPFSRASPQLHSQRVSGSPLQLLWSNSRRELEVAIQSQKSEDHKSWDEDLLSEETRLDQRLSKLRLEMFVMAGDGNCQFRAISFELYGTQDYHKAVRKTAIEYMKAHPDEFAPFLDEQCDRYLRSMARNGTWGDELTLRATSDAYGVVVNVITSEQHNWFMRYYPQDKKLPKEIFLTYIAPVHYNAVRRRKISKPLTFTRRHSLIADALEKARLEEARIASIPESSGKDLPGPGQLIQVGAE